MEIEVDMIRMSLSNRFVDCPKHWQNFIIEIQGDKFEDVSLEVIQKHLGQYTASYYEESSGKNYVYFTDEKLYTMFVLRYS
jgi:hypothetical protein